ncbi:MAG: hypothetical protein KGN01_07790 [Patescibacteria group bacterium]|nr:hypothetical protein [Patescibacteria group bacterium]
MSRLDKITEEEQICIGAQFYGYIDGLFCEINHAYPLMPAVARQLIDFRVFAFLIAAVHEFVDVFDYQVEIAFCAAQLQYRVVKEFGRFYLRFLFRRNDKRIAV